MQRINFRCGSPHTVNEIAAALFPSDHQVKTVWAKRRNSEWPLAVFQEHLPRIPKQKRHEYWDVVQGPLSPNWAVTSRHNDIRDKDINLQVWIA